MDWQLETPVAFFIFNRPKKTEQVFERISDAQPSTLLVIADGPRDGHPDDSEYVRRARAVVDKNLDWSCNVKRNYADRNLGIRERFVSGLEWVFSRVNRAIILEDDCVPNRSFFRFCHVMLEKYKEDERIMDVTGRNHLGEWKSNRQDYHFSNYGGIWGWATWRRAWELYDPEMTLWEDPEIQDRLRDVIADDDQYRYLRYIYGRVYEGEEETWDYQWGFARHINSALSVVPSKNLISNIGFDQRATHTSNERSKLSRTPRYDLDFPLRTNDFVAVDREYDRRFHEMRPISHRSRLLRAGNKIYSRFRDRLADL